MPCGQERAVGPGTHFAIRQPAAPMLRQRRGADEERDEAL